MEETRRDDFIVPGYRLAETPNIPAGMPGFANTLSTEAERGALPIGKNSPQRPPLGLYAEQLSGTAFTAPREENRRSWLYRIAPSVTWTAPFQQTDHPYWLTAGKAALPPAPPVQLRWGPLTPPEGDHDLIDGIRTMTVAGDVAARHGFAAHAYTATQDMDGAALNADGETMLLPQDGALKVTTELGVLVISPGEIAVVPAGVAFTVQLIDESARGFMGENYGALFELPPRGAIGANGLANERDFLSPVAAYEDKVGAFRLRMKWQGHLYEKTLDHSPFDVVAWHGNYAPYKYDLRRFNTIGSISYDHPDPSIFTVLTSPSARPGTANADFVIFPERWLVMEDTFRPPWYHKNIMSEFMGLIYGVYDAKPGGFKPGGMSLHNAMLPHGPDAEAFEKATERELTPDHLTGTMAFMFETHLVQQPTAFALDHAPRDEAYPRCWKGLRRAFKRP